MGLGLLVYSFPFLVLLPTIFQVHGAIRVICLQRLHLKKKGCLIRKIFFSGNPEGRSVVFEYKNEMISC